MALVPCSFQCIHSTIVPEAVWLEVFWLFWQVLFEMLCRYRLIPTVAKKCHAVNPNSATRKTRRKTLATDEGSASFAPFRGIRRAIAMSLLLVAEVDSGEQTDTLV